MVIRLCSFRHITTHNANSDDPPEYQASLMMKPGLFSRIVSVVLSIASLTTGEVRSKECIVDEYCIQFPIYSQNKASLDKSMRLTSMSRKLSCDQSQYSW